jgi:hypothetical protein
MGTVHHSIQHSLLAAGIETVWSTEHTGLRALTALERANVVELIEDKLRDLKPENEMQRQTLNRAFQITSELGQTRWLLIEQTQLPLPLPLLIILVFWLAGTNPLGKGALPIVSKNS